MFFEPWANLERQFLRAWRNWTQWFMLATLVADGIVDMIDDDTWERLLDTAASPIILPVDLN